MGFYYCSWFKNQGSPNHLFEGRPVIGICNTWSELTPCNAHLREIAEVVQRGQLLVDSRAQTDLPVSQALSLVTNQY